MNGARRKGFTLIELSLAIVVGLLVTAGAIAGYFNYKEQAANAMATRRVALAAGAIAEYAASSSGSYPTSTPGGGAFTTYYQQHFADDYGASPWGGPTGATNGVIELAPIANGGPDAQHALDVTGQLGTAANQAGSLVYASLTPGTYVQVMPLEAPAAVIAKNYVVSICDDKGEPWFSVSGGH